MTDRRKPSIRTAAIGASLVAVVGAGVAFAVDPFPTNAGDPDPGLAALERRERALAAEADRVAALSARRWDAYRRGLAESAAPASPPITYIPAAPVTNSESS